MRRITINALVDIGCLIAFVPSLITGLVLYLFLPEGRFMRVSDSVRHNC